MSPPKRRPVTAKKERKAVRVRVRVDLHKEYAEQMKKKGICEVVRLDNSEAMVNIRGRIPTGSLALDRVLRNPLENPEWEGIPLGRAIEFYGPPFIGKSTLLDMIMAQCQAMGGEAVLADTEVSRDRHYSKRLGVDLSKLNYLEFKRGGMYLENVLASIFQTITFWGEKAPDTPVVIGLDALGGTATKEEMGGALQIGEKANQPGKAAKVMHEAARNLPEMLRGRKIALVVLNHEYDMIGSFGGFGGHKPKETYGGSGVRHLATNRVQLRRGYVNIKKADGTYLGQEVTAKLTKNRLGDSFVEARLPILSGVGVENVYTVFEDLKDAKVIVSSGGWAAINLDGEVINFQGWSGLKTKCAETPGLWDRLVSVWKQVTYPKWEVPDADLHV